MLVEVEWPALYCFEPVAAERADLFGRISSVYIKT